MIETRLRQERMQREQSTYEVAQAAGVSQSHYFRVENGETGASPEMAEKLAAHFGLEVAELFSPLRYMPEPAEAA
jgi:transcriptional regulator with XRE-family HTH domain